MPKALDRGNCNAFCYNTRQPRKETMQATIKDGKLIIEIDLQTLPEPSASGKTMVVASTHGNQVTSLMIEGQPVVIGVNAYIKKAAKA